MIWIGTSGFQYPEWKGTFYPLDLPAAKMLDFYSREFSTTEINYTFYRFPALKTLENWAALTPPGFAFSLKAPRRITHDNKLQNCAELVTRFCHSLETLGPKLGVVLFQLPPSFKKDLALLQDFMDCLPLTLRAAFEFRHPSWHSDDIYDLLKLRNRALCIADSEERKTPMLLTADFGYFRLRDEGYQRKDITQWARSIGEQAKAVEHLFIYFKHEEKGLGPQFARWLIEDLKEGPP